MDKGSLVSVVIPTYNQSRLLAETLKSVFAQTFTDFDVVVVDDGSTDDTPEFLRRWVEESGGRLRVVTQPNQGVGAARNRGIAEARGKYVAPLDHDDLWEPRKLEAQVRFMEQNPACASCTVPWARMGSPETATFDVRLAHTDGGIVERPLRLIAQGHALMMTSALMFDRERAAGLRYETPRQTVEDLAMQINLLDRGAFGVADDRIMMLYREHAANFSSYAIRYYNGHRMLRRLEAEDKLGDRQDPQRRQDLRSYLAGHGRVAATALLCAGMRARAASIYAADFFEQAREGRFKFLLGFPVLLAAPSGMVRRRFPAYRVQ